MLTTSKKKMPPGRPKGSKNKHNKNVDEIAARYNLQPFDVLMMVAAGDWKGLGYDAPTRTSFAASGIEFEEPVIKISDRIHAAKEASKYLYSAKQSISIDVNQIHKMSDDEFEKFKAQTIEAHFAKIEDHSEEPDEK